MRRNPKCEASVGVLRGAGKIDGAPRQLRENHALIMCIRRFAGAVWWPQSSVGVSGILRGTVAEPTAAARPDRKK